MSSVERDLAEYVLSVYRDAVDLNYDNMSREDLIEHIEMEKREAKNHYIDFALAYGWYDAREDAEADVTLYEDIAEGMEQATKVEGPLTFLRIREWLAKGEGLEPYLIGRVLEERPKAIFFKPEDGKRRTYGYWLPKSQIIIREDDTIG